MVLGYAIVRIQCRIQVVVFVSLSAPLVDLPERWDHGHIWR